MLIAIFLGGQIHLLVGLVLGTAVYVGSLFALRVIGKEERGGADFASEDWGAVGVVGRLNTIIFFINVILSLRIDE